MNTSKWLYDDNELGESASVDFIAGETRNVEDTWLEKFINWTLTINVNQKDSSGYVDALIITISEEQYPKLTGYDDQDPEYTVDQFPSGWEKENVIEFVKLHRERIEKIIDEFTEECESQG